MVLVSLTPPLNTPLDVDAATDAILRAIAGARITADNAFEAERVRKQMLMLELERSGQPIKNPEMILAVIRNKERALGPAKSISLILGGGVIFEGQVAPSGVILRADCAAPHRAVEELVGVLRWLCMGGVDVHQL